MSKIKSKKSLTFINDRLDNVTDMLSPAAILELKMCMIEAAVIAESESEERHTKELQDIHDMYKQIFFEHHREYEADKANQLQKLIDAHDVDKYHTENNHQIELQELKDKAIEAFKSACGFYLCEECCEYCDKYYQFIDKLTI